MSLAGVVAIIVANLLPALAYLANFTMDDTLAHYAAQVRLWEARSGDDGTAVYVFFILGNQLSFINIDTHLAFHLDGETSPSGTFDRMHDPTVEGFLYNQLVFSTNSLHAGEHTMVIRCAAKGTSPSLALFDYAIYSAEVEEFTSDDSPSSTAVPRATVAEPVARPYAPPQLSPSPKASRIGVLFGKSEPRRAVASVSQRADSDIPPHYVP
ncbi:hypothetical protein AURDEDRAFT_175128 [Auricularia subglabra TFB-10046 SS5]|nr:hypothetical protein AURDEDRAFT_175128 [Auricularia subglabra TFB-10046 SS5]